MKAGVADLPFQPVFCDVLVGDDAVSAQYVRMKAKAAEEIGIAFHPAFFPETISEEELIAEIKKINDIPHMCGIILQLPLPEHVDTPDVRNAICPEFDLDCLGAEASKNFYDNSASGYPAAGAVIAVLDSLHIDLPTKNILVMGQGELVGAPVTHMLEARGLAVNTMALETHHKEEKIKNADVLISGIGRGRYITGAMIKEGAVIIDAGTSESKGGIVGDVDLESVTGIASAVSPVPGGVGPVTIAMLLKSVVAVARNRVP